MKADQFRNIAKMSASPLNPAQAGKKHEHLYTVDIEPVSCPQDTEMASPYVDTHRVINNSTAPFSLHSHTFFEYLCCRTTCGVEYLVGSKRYSLQKGDIIFIPPGVSHRPILPDHMDVPYDRDIIWVSLDHFSEIRRILNAPLSEPLPEPTTYLIRTAATKWEFLCDIFHNGVKEFESKQYGWEAAVIGNTTMLISYIHRAYIDKSVKTINPESQELLDQIIEYIEAHYTNKIVKSNVAKQFYVSERTISTLFNQRLGVTFLQFVTQRRLVAAKALILDGKGLESVGYEVGFSDYSTFYRAFKAEFGISPREFKKGVS